MYNIQELYRLNIELEGLLRVLEQRDSKEARELLAQKFKLYSESMQQLLDCAQTTQPTACEADVRNEIKNQEAESAEVVPEFVAAEAAVAREGHKAATAMATATTVAEAAAENARSLKLDEMLSARQSADLSKAFTLNDKYRFRRELFGGSDSDFSQTIGLIVQMNSYEEARNYLLHDLCWDSRNEAVEDFLTIIKRHFQA